MRERIQKRSCKGESKNQTYNVSLERSRPIDLCNSSVLNIHRHTVNVLSALPLQCLDVLLSVRLSEGSMESGGVNMDCVHTLLLFMEKRLDRVRKSALNSLVFL